MDAAEVIIFITVSILQAIVFIFDIILYPIYYILQNPVAARKCSNKARAQILSCSDDAITLKSTITPTALHLEIQQNCLCTVPAAVRYFSQKYCLKKCLGTRQVLGEEEELQPNGKMFVKLILGKYTWKTYCEVSEKMTNFGRGLRELGIEPKDRVAIFAETREEWIIAAVAAFNHSIILVTVYSTLGEDGRVHAINETDVSMIITSFDLLPKIVEILPKLRNVNTIIYMENPLKKFDCRNYNLKGYHIFRFKDVAAAGAHSTIEETFPKPSDTAVIMYTSGATGPPKGVVLLHINIMSTVASFCDKIATVDIGEEPINIAFLPLAHVFEMTTEFVCFCANIAIGYSNPLTVLDNASKVKMGCKGDVTVLKPTIMLTVPLILDRLYKGVCEKVNSSNMIFRIAFTFAYKYKKCWRKRGFRTNLIDRYVFKKISNTLGGKMKLIIAGGAPLTDQTQEMINICFCVKLLQGYGLTETASSATVMDNCDLSIGCVGSTCTNCLIKMTNWPEQGYRVSDFPYPRGELNIGGENIANGYYNLPEETKESFYADCSTNWFKTGDIAELRDNGIFKIIDRKKDLVKLANGEYISLGKIEANLKTLPIIDNICVVPNQEDNYCVGIIVPNQAELILLGKKINLCCTTPSDLMDNNVIITSIMDSIKTSAKLGKLLKTEMPTGIILVKETWTPESGLVTATLKLNRRNIAQFYKSDLTQLYCSLNQS